MIAGGAGKLFLVLLSFFAGVCAHALYQRWKPVVPVGAVTPPPAQSYYTEGQSHPVNFVPLPAQRAGAETAKELEKVTARDIEKIRSLAGQQARVHGRVFRVGHASKSNTYFLNFGPSRESLTAVIFSSSVELFEKDRQSPKRYENREVEIIGFIKDHPQYGLEIILENPKQIKILN